MNCYEQKNGLQIDGEILIETNYANQSGLDTYLRHRIRYRVEFSTDASTLGAYEEMRLKLISEVEKIEKYIKEQKGKL